MTLGAIDWAVIVLYFVVSVAIALVYSRRAGSSSEEFFLSGRSIPWWLAGTSMVATTFAADTPLAVTGLTVKHGIAGNWLWWSFVMSGMLTVFFFARGEHLWLPGVWMLCYGQGALATTQTDLLRGALEQRVAALRFGAAQRCPNNQAHRGRRPPCRHCLRERRCAHRWQSAVRYAEDRAGWSGRPPRWRR